MPPISVGGETAVVVTPEPAIKQRRFAGPYYGPVFILAIITFLLPLPTAEFWALMGTFASILLCGVHFNLIEPELTKRQGTSPAWSRELTGWLTGVAAASLVLVLLFPNPFWITVVVLSVPWSITAWLVEGRWD